LFKRSLKTAAWHGERSARSYMKRKLHWNLSGNEVDHTECSLLVLLKRACSKPHWQRGFNLILFSYKIGGERNGEARGRVDAPASHGPRAPRARNLLFDSEARPSSVPTKPELFIISLKAGSPEEIKRPTSSQYLE